MFDYLVTAFMYVAGTTLLCLTIIVLVKIVEHVLNEIYDRDPWK